MVYTVSGPLVMYGDKTVGYTDHILVDVFQKDVVKVGDPETMRVSLPVGDYLFLTPEKRLVVVEEKRLGDLVSSYSSRRLQRQLRRVRLANPDGVSVVALRASGERPALEETMWAAMPPELMVDLVKWQLLGGLVGFLPHDPHEALGVLRTWQAILHPGVHLFSIVAGSDLEPKRERLTEVAYALRKLFVGVGPKTGAAWAAAAHEHLLEALTMPDEALKPLGVRPAVVRKRKELV